MPLTLAGWLAHLEALHPRGSAGIELGLERVATVKARLGQRETCPVVLVGGTNGKGSTCAMLERILLAAGYRVGLYTSPHLLRYNERVRINGVAADDAGLCAAFARVELARGDAALTYFEFGTLAAWEVFAGADLDAVILEVGLGGRLDATTAIAASVAVVTGVAMDHQAILGDTLAKIAAEKAGIFRPGQRVVIGASGEPAAVPVLIAAARVAERTTVIDDAAIARVPFVGLPGEHQRRNAAAAIAAVEHLGFPVEASALAHVRHPGRFERVGDVILDGAHNPHGAAALAAALDGPVTLVIGTSADKDAAGIAAALAPRCRHVIATRYQQERAMVPAQLAGCFAGAETAPDLATALARARDLGGPIVIAGSLFLVGEARVLLLGAPADPVWVSDPPAR